MRNEAALRKVGDLIADEPDRYDQSLFLIETQDQPCKTVGCVAGHAATLHPDVGKQEEGAKYWFVKYHEPNPNPRTFGEEQHVWSMATLTDGRRTYGVESLAREVLGLSPRESERLFAGDWVPLNCTNPDDPYELATSVRDALYDLAEGASIEDVTYYRWHDMIT